MKQIALTVVLVLVVCVVAAGPSRADLIANGHNWFWADEFGMPLIGDVDEFGVPLNSGYIEANPGDTVTVWSIANNTGGSWQGLDQIRQELWWDTAVVANYTSDPATDGTPYPSQFYGEWDDPGTPEAELGSHVVSPPGNNYGAAPDWSTPQYNHYMKLDFWYSYMWMYEGMSVVGYNIPIRPDAPLGMTELGGSLIGTLWGGIYRYDTIDGSDPFGLKINVVSDALPGDFDEDGDVDADDVDDLCANMTGDGVPPIDAKYDLDGDGDTDNADMDILIHDLVETTVGVGTEYADFNLDGEVNTTDLTILATNFGLGTTWTEGNANCDTDVNTTDLTILATNFGFVASGVPEPATMSLLTLGGLALLRRRSR